MALLAERALAAGFGGLEWQDEEGEVDDLDEPAAGEGDLDVGDEEHGAGRASCDDSAGGAAVVREPGALSPESGADGVGEPGAPPAESGAPCGCSRPPFRSTRAERCLALIHVDAGVLREGMDEDDDGLGGSGGGGGRVAGTGARPGGRGSPAGTDGCAGGSTGSCCAGTGRADGSGPDPSEPGVCYLEDGVPISVETVRRLTCDGSVVHVLRGSEDSVLDIGRRSRTIPPAIRRALTVRDGGCRWPGCTSRFIEGHHVKHWALGGETKLSNLLSLCLHHHRCVHEGGFKVQARADGTFRIYDRTGWPLPDCPPPAPPLPEEPLEALVRAHRKRGIAPDAETPSATFEREADIPDEMMHRFWNVLDPS